MSQLDDKAYEMFAGKVVKKDLVRKIKVGANVPIYVLEYLLGKYCSSHDEVTINAGLQTVKDILSQNFVRADESEKIKSFIKQSGSFKIIDKVRVRLLESEDKYWAECINLGQKYMHIPEMFIQKYERLLAGGIWAMLSVDYIPEEEVRGTKRPFFIKDIRPIQLATFRLEEYQEGRSQLTTSEWIDLLMRSIGLEPMYFDQRLKLLFLSRLIPMVERNFNFVELGPRGTGKSFVYREISPYSILISGGKTTVPNLFYNMATGKMGLVGLWDVVAFDEVAGIRFSDSTAVQILKDYMESGSFSRGREELVADASMVFIGNINTNIEVLVKTGNLFQPLPDSMQDMALIDRFHFYMPGWETPKMQTEFFTEHFGFVVDYLAEAFKELRKLNFTDAIDTQFSLGSHLNARDAKAVRKTISGLLKLLHPDGNYTVEELGEYLELALEGRRRVKEQLKKMGSYEYFQTSFSYIETENMQEHFVGVPEEGGRNLISPDPLNPGSVYTSAFTDDKVTLHNIQVSRMPGNGKLVVTGRPGKAMKDSIRTAFDYILSRKRELGIEKDIESYDYHVQVIDLMASKEGSEAGVAFFVALYSVLQDRPVQAGLIILGEMTIHGNILPIRSLTEPLQMAMDNGAKKVILPVENKRNFLDVPGDIFEKIDPIFYADPLTAALKALDMH